MSERDDLHRAMEIADKYGLSIASRCSFKTCKLCGEPFVARYKQREICSLKCKKSHWYAKNSERLKALNKANYRKRREART